MIAIQVQPFENSFLSCVYPEEAGLLYPFTAQTNVAVAGARPDESVIRTVLLLSRLPRYTSAESEWLQAVRKAVDFIGEQRWSIIVSSPGSGWEYTAWYAGRCHIPIVLVLPPDHLKRMHTTCDDITRQMNLDITRTTFLMPIVSARMSKPDRLHMRDKVAFVSAHRRFPISTRKDGFWQSVIKDAPGIDNRFTVPYPRHNNPSQTSIKKNVVNQKHRTGWEDMLIHWTRGVYGPWPGETRADYFEALTKYKSGNPRDAFATLEHILSTGVLRGEGKMIRGGTPVVSFTECNPCEILESVSYRNALGRWNYEPYGIAIRRSRLLEFGAQPVIYGDKNDFDQLNPVLKPFFQYKGQKTKTRRTDWMIEKEWRIIGDIDLESIRENVKVIVPLRKEAERLQEISTFKIVALEV